VSVNAIIKLGNGSITLPRNVSVGDLIVVHTGANAAVEALALTSPRVTGNFDLVCNSDLTKPNRGAIYAKVATSAGACTITSSGGNQAFSQIWAGVILSGVLPADVTAVAYSAAGSAGNTATPVTTTGANRVIVAGVVGWHNATVFAAVSGNLRFDYIGGSDAMGVMVTDAPTAGAYTPIISQSDRDNNPLCIAAFTGAWPAVEGAQITQFAVEAAHLSISNVRFTQFVVEVVRSIADRPSTVVSPETLALDCTIAGIINQAMLESGIDVGQVTTRGTLGSHIVRYRAALLGRIAAIWEGVEVGDIEAALASPTSLVDMGEIIMVEARRTSDQVWFPVPVVPLNE